MFFFCFWKADVPVVDLGTARFTLHTRTRDPTTCKYGWNFRRERTLVTLATQTNVDSPKRRAFPHSRPILRVSSEVRTVFGPIPRILGAPTRYWSGVTCMCTRTNYSKIEFSKLSSMPSHSGRSYDIEKPHRLNTPLFICSYGLKRNICGWIPQSRHGKQRFQRFRRFFRNI